MIELAWVAGIELTRTHFLGIPVEDVSPDSRGAGAVVSMSIRSSREQGRVRELTADDHAAQT